MDHADSYRLVIVTSRLVTRWHCYSGIFVTTFCSWVMLALLLVTKKGERVGVKFRLSVMRGLWEFPNSLGAGWGPPGDMASHKTHREVLPPQNLSGGGPWGRAMSLPRFVGAAYVRQALGPEERTEAPFQFVAECPLWLAASFSQSMLV